MLRSDADADRVLKTVEKVRAAHIRVLNSHAARLPQSGANAERFAEIGKEIARWSGLTVEDILDVYRNVEIEPGFVRRYKRGASEGDPSRVERKESPSPWPIRTHEYAG